MSARGTPKVPAVRRKAGGSAAIGPHRTPSCWVDSEQGVAFTAAMPRVRDGLVLRPVAERSRGPGKDFSDARGAR